MPHYPIVVVLITPPTGIGKFLQNEIYMIAITSFLIHYSAFSAAMAM